MRLLVRTIGIARAQVTTGRANPACHVTHLARLGTRTAPASPTAPMRSGTAVRRVTRPCHQSYVMT
jgi:hypothetical protein